MQWASEESTIGMVERVFILKTFAGFSGLDASELAAMASVCRERFFPKGAVMHEPGKPVMAFHLIVEGEVQSYRSGRPAQVFGAKSTIGGLASLTRDPEGAHAVALQDTLALEIDTDDMQDVFEDNFGVLLGVLAALARGLRALQIQAGGGVAQQPKQSFVEIGGEGPLTLMDKMFILRQSTQFGATSIEALAEFACDATERRYAAGDEIWSRGAPADWSLLVVSGKVECQPEDLDSFEMGAGFIVGGLDSLGRMERWYRTVATTDVRALILERTKTYDVLEDHTDVAMTLMRNLAAAASDIAERLAR